MRLAVLSDIHGNLEAFRAVLCDMDALAPDGAISLGDVIGYGPQPEECVALLREREIPSVLGNHELGIVDPAYREWFNPHSGEALDITRSLLSGETVRFLAGLPALILAHGARFVHGAPPDSPTTYLYEYEPDRLPALFRAFAEPLCFVGHTHDLALVSGGVREAERLDLPQGISPLSPLERHVVNAGSVGQPRDGDNRAKYVLWDDAAMSLEVRYVAYDVARTVALIRERGLPERYARRLL